MNRRAQLSAFVALVSALGHLPSPASAVSPWLGGTCLSAGNGGAFETCSIETNYVDTNNVLQDLCNDNIDNDGNGYVDADGNGNPALIDPNCQVETLCQDGYDNDGGGGMDSADTDCQCLTNIFGTEPNCTANDFTISYTAQPLVSDGCVNQFDTVLAVLTASVTSGNPARHDLGLWLSLGTHSAIASGHCTRQMLMPVSTTGQIDFNGNGNYLVIDADKCGDGDNGSSAVFDFPYVVELPCADLVTPINGFVDLRQCGSWVQPGGDTTCNNIGNINTGTSSKCRCAQGKTGIPGPKIAKSCSAFEDPAGLGDGLLDPGETATFTIGYTNTVPGCTSGAPAGGDPFGRNRCGTASFVRIVVNYGNLDSHGDFYVNNGGPNLPIPTCPSTVAIDTDPTAATNFGEICNANVLVPPHLQEATDNYLIFAPRDPNLSNTLGVLSAFTGTQTLPILYTFTTNTNPPPTLSTMTSRIWWDDLLDTSPANSAITAAEAVDLTGAIEQDCTNCDCSTTVQATPITLSSFEATPAGRGARFEWSTETEVGNVGFDLYALVDGKRRKLNDEPIPAAGIDSLEPQSYEAYFDVPDGVEGFVLEDLDLTGKARAHGPFEVGKKYGEKIRPEPIDWAAVRREHGLGKQGDARQVGRGHGRDGTAGGARARASKGGGGGSTTTPTIEFHVDRDGIYRVTYEQLLAAGFDLATQAGSGFALRSGGKLVPIFVSTSGRFGPGNFLEFWGEALDTLYTGTNVYRLDVGQRKPPRVGIDTTAPAGAAATTYTERRHIERNLGYAFWSPAADPFFDLEMLAFSSPQSFSRNFTVNSYAAGVGPSKIRVEVFGGSTFKGVNPDHHVEFRVNGVLLGEAKFDGMSGHVFEAEIPDGVLVEGTNTLAMRLPSVPGAAYDLVSLESLELEHPRLFKAKTGALDFVAAGSRFDVAGLTSPAAVAYRESGGTLTRLNGTTVAPDGGGFVASLPGLAGGARYRVAGEDALLTPAAIQSARVAGGLETGPASYLVISHAAFLGGMQPLVDARAAQGHTVKVVDVEDVYARFSHGIYDAEAIRRYIAYAYSSMGTRYVLLVGGDTYDYRDYLGLAPVSFVPSLYRETSETVRFAPSDSTYADVDFDDLQDLAIGRMPVRTQDELAAVLAKTLQYDARTYLDTATFAADYADAGANESFTNASNRLVQELPPTWQVDRIYLDQTPLTTARTRLFADIASGSGLTSYVGHSGPTSWGSSLKPVSQHLFKIADVPLLTNAGLPTVVTQLGCWNTYYASPKTEALGPRLLLVADKGAAAVLGATTLTEDANGNRFGGLLTPRLVAAGATLGDAIWQAKRDFVEFSSPDADLRDILVGWNLLGDPALRIVP